MTSVIDSSVILALLHREQGWERAKEEMVGGVASTLIQAEFVTRLAIKGVSQSDIVEAWDEFRIPVHAFDEEQAMAAGLLARQTKPFGLSLADRACLTLARQLGTAVVTADRAWAKLDIGVEIKLIR